MKTNMIYQFVVSFEGWKTFSIDAATLDEARDELSAELEWEVPNLQYYQVLNEVELSEADENT